MHRDTSVLNQQEVEATLTPVTSSLSTGDGTELDSSTGSAYQTVHSEGAYTSAAYAILRRGAHDVVRSTNYRDVHAVLRAVEVVTHILQLRRTVPA